MGVEAGVTAGWRTWRRQKLDERSAEAQTINEWGAPKSPRRETECPQINRHCQSKTVENGARRGCKKYSNEQDQTNRKKQNSSRMAIDSWSEKGHSRAEIRNQIPTRRAWCASLEDNRLNQISNQKDQWWSKYEWQKSSESARSRWSPRQAPALTAQWGQRARVIDL